MTNGDKFKEVFGLYATELWAMPEEEFLKWIKENPLKVDRISLENAVATPIWLLVWAAEPERQIDVRMSYSDLKKVCDLIEQAQKEKGMSNDEAP